LAGKPLPPDLVVFGEVGLAGEVRQVGHAKRRLIEAARLGFRRAIVPAHSPDGVEGMSVHRVATLTEALSAAGLTGP
jgi:DNA repair protein RadA/Sms